MQIQVFIPATMHLIVEVDVVCLGIDFSIVHFNTIRHLTMQ